MSTIGNVNGGTISISHLIIVKKITNYKPIKISEDCYITRCNKRSFYGCFMQQIQ